MLTVNVIRESASRSSPIVGASIVGEEELKAAYARTGEPFPYTFENRNNWKTFEAAEAVAKALGAGYVATDAGEWVSPRYDVIDLPKIGDDVSYGFNGDAYPCGKIKKISAGPGFRRIVAGPDFTGADKVFWRRCRDGKPTGGAWISGETWSLIPGHINKRNPEF